MNRENKIEFLDETWRPPTGGRKPKAGRGTPLVDLTAVAAKHSLGSIKAKLDRITTKAPEVVVRVSGRQRGGSHTLAHLDYIGRHGQLEAETDAGARLSSTGQLAELAAEWADHEMRTTRRREPLTSVSLILSMPPGHAPDHVLAAVRAFGRIELEAFPHAMALHTDTDHPHVHVTVAARGEGGQRFNPHKVDLARWRETFARELRARGIAAEATPRRARGVSRRSEAFPVRKMRERAEREGGVMPRVIQGATSVARMLAKEAPPVPRPWETKAIARQAKIRAAYLEAADHLSGGDAADRALARRTRVFVSELPNPATRDRKAAIEIANARDSRGRSSDKGRTR